MSSDGGLVWDMWLVTMALNKDITFHEFMEISKSILADFDERHPDGYIMNPLRLIQETLEKYEATKPKQ